MFENLSLDASDRATESCSPSTQPKLAFSSPQSINLNEKFSRGLI